MSRAHRGVPGSRTDGARWRWLGPAAVPAEFAPGPEWRWVQVVTAFAERLPVPARLQGHGIGPMSYPNAEHRTVRIAAMGLPRNCRETAWCINRMPLKLLYKP